MILMYNIILFRLTISKHKLLKNYSKDSEIPMILNWLNNKSNFVLMPSKLHSILASMPQYLNKLFRSKNYNKKTKYSNKPSLNKIRDQRDKKENQN